MCRKSVSLGLDPMNGYRFSEKDLFKQENLEA